MRRFEQVWVNGSEDIKISVLTLWTMVTRQEGDCLR